MSPKVTSVIYTSVAWGGKFLFLRVTGQNDHIQVSGYRGSTWLRWGLHKRRGGAERITWLYKPPCLDTSCFCRGESFLSDTLIVVRLCVRCMLPPVGVWIHKRTQKHTEHIDHQSASRSTIINKLPENWFGSRDDLWPPGSLGDSLPMDV